MKRLVALMICAVSLGAAAQIPDCLPVPFVNGSLTNHSEKAAQLGLMGAIQNNENVLFYESFSNGFAGSNGMGSWTTADNVGDSLWIYAQGLTDTGWGLGIYADGTATGVTHPAGEFSTNFGILQSTSGNDGFMIFDCDYFNTPVSNGYVDVEGSLTSPVLDFSSEGSLIVQWESYFRYCCYPYPPIFLEVGVIQGGSTTWTTFPAHGDFIPSANTASQNPQITQVDVSCAAAFQDSVQIRFSYRQPDEVGEGYSHYYWGIDDVQVYDSTPNHDLEVKAVLNGNVENGFEYLVTPMEQSSNCPEGGGLVVGVVYSNKGQETEYGVEAIITLSNSNDEVIYSSSSTIDVIYSPSESPTCPHKPDDTLYVYTFWSPQEVGLYSLGVELVLEEDSDPSNNVAQKTIEYSTNRFGHDDEEQLDGEMRPRESDEIPGFFDPTGYGAFYACPNPGTFATGLAIRFGPNCGLDIDGNPDEFDFETRLYEFNPTSGLTGSTFEASYWIFDESWVNVEGGENQIEIELLFDQPIPMTEQAIYFAAVISEYDMTAELTVLAQLNSDTDNSTGRYNEAADGSFVWFTSQTSTPAVRLVTSSSAEGPLVCFGCTIEVACNYDPYASEDDGSCIFTCPGCTEAGACNFDPDANLNDGTCDYFTCAGCTDESACNWDVDAILEDGSCLYVDVCGICGGPGAIYECGCEGVAEGYCDCEFNVLDECGVCAGDDSSCTGCTYPSACNYDPSATILDATECVFGECGGCLDAAACNYNPTVAFDDGSCAYTFDALGVCGGDCLADVNGNGICDIEEACLGEFDECGVCEGPGAIYVCGCNDIPQGDCDCLGNELDAIGVCGGACNADLNGDGICDGISGCTYEIASNFNPSATEDDGSCLFDTVVDDCGLIHDTDGDGSVGTDDLLSLLAEFGQSCD